MSKLTDAELTALYAEKVLGLRPWKNWKDGDYDGPYPMYCTEAGVSESSVAVYESEDSGGPDWYLDPLASDTDAWRGMDLHKDKWIWSLERRVDGRGLIYRAMIWTDPTEKPIAIAVDPTNRRRALVLAQLRAVGEDV